MAVRDGVTQARRQRHTITGVPKMKETEQAPSLKGFDFPPAAQCVLLTAI
jgi:hypothetical protein